MIIKQEPVSKIRRGVGYFRNRGRGGRGYAPEANVTGYRRCFYCDASNFTLEHFANCAAKGITCNACQKIEHFERTCSGVRRSTNQWQGRGQVGLVHDDNEHHQSTHSVDSSYMQEELVGWVNQQQEGAEEISIFSRSDDYMVMSIK